MIESVSIKNFKSIKDSKVNFPFFGAIVGQNAAGKTNFIQAIDFIKMMISGNNTSAKLDTKLSLVPQDLFNFNEQSTNLSISITLKTSDEIKYVLDVELKLTNGGSPARLLVTQEKLRKFGLNSSEETVYLRNENSFLDKDGLPIPLAVEPSSLAISIYSNPDVVIVKKLFNKIQIPDLEEMNSRESIVTGKDNELGIANLLVRLRHDDVNSFEHFQKIVQKIVPSFSSIVEMPAPSNAPDQEKTYIVLLEERDLAGKLSMQSVSAGDLRTLFLIASAISMDDNSTLFIEEIENGLHPARVLDVLSHLERISIKKDIQILFTTHSSKVINSLSPNKIVFVNKSTPEGTKLKLLSESDENTQVQRILDSGGSITDYLNVND